MLPEPMPRETLACLLDTRIPVQFIKGNGDREVLAQMIGIETDWYHTAPEQWLEPVRWTTQQLLPEHKTLFADWPTRCHLEVGGLGEVLFCHAKPRNDTEIFTDLTAEDRNPRKTGRKFVPFVQWTLPLITT